MARIEESLIAGRLQRRVPVSTVGIQRSVGWSLGLLHLLSGVVLLDIYIALTLRLFPATEAFSAQYFEFVIKPAVILVRAIVAFLPNMIEIVVITALTLASLKLIRFFFRSIEMGVFTLPGFYKDWADPTYRLVRMIMLVFLLVRIVPLLPGADEKAFKAVSLFVGALLSIGSTGAMKPTRHTEGPGPRGGESPGRGGRADGCGAKK